MRNETKEGTNRVEGAYEKKAERDLLLLIELLCSHPTHHTKGTGRHTAGLNKPPDTLKNTHTLTIKLNPKLNAIKSNTLVFGACVMLPFSCPADPGSLYVADAEFGSTGLSRSFQC